MGNLLLWLILVLGRIGLWRENLFCCWGCHRLVIFDCSCYLRHCIFSCLSPFYPRVVFPLSKTTDSRSFQFPLFLSPPSVCLKIWFFRFYPRICTSRWSTQSSGPLQPSAGRRGFFRGEWPLSQELSTLQSGLSRDCCFLRRNLQLLAIRVSSRGNIIIFFSGEDVATM